MNYSLNSTVVSFQNYLAVQYTKKAFAVGMLIARLKMKGADQSEYAGMFETTRKELKEAKRIFREVGQQ